MKLSELLCEQSHEDLAHDALITLITTNHALGMTEISAKKLLKSLEDRNFFMDSDWLWDHVQQIPIVDADASTKSLIKIKQPTDTDTDVDSDADSDKTDADAPDTNSKTVDRMAKRALAKRNK